MNNSQNVNGNNNKVNNNQFQFFNHNQEPDIVPYNKTPLTVFNKQVKTFWFLIGAIVSFAANLATVYTSLKEFKKLQDISLAYLVLSSILFLLFMFFLSASFRTKHV